METINESNLGDNQALPDLGSRKGNYRRIYMAAGEQEEVRQIKQTVEEWMDSHRPYLLKRYSLNVLAWDTQIKIHKLSVYLNRVVGVNFTDFINYYRVKYCLEIIQQAEVKKVNLAELGKVCGFNNRNTFTNAFKRILGIPPSEYIKTIRKPKHG